MFLVFQSRKGEFTIQDGTIAPVYATKHVVDITPSGLLGLLQCGLCQSSDEGFLFTTKDSFDDIDFLLHEEFTTLFDYLDENRPTSGPAYEAGLSPWLICIKRPYRKPGVLVFSSDAGGKCPTGKDVISALSMSKRNRRNFTETILYLGKHSESFSFDREH